MAPSGPLIADFGHADSARRLAAVEALCDHDATQLEPHVPRLVRLLSDSDEEVRATATAMLDMCSKPSVAQHAASLLELLDEESADVRLGVTTVLATLDAESLSAGALKILERASNDPDESVRNGLGKIAALKFSSQQLSALIAAQLPQRARSFLRPESAPLRAAILERLNSVPVFCVQSVDDNSVCAETVDGRPCGTFFVDVRDAEDELSDLKQHEPSLTLAIQTMPLGTALECSERWSEQSQAAGVRMRIQASKAELDDLPGFPDLPEELQGAFSQMSSSFPVWVCEKMRTATERPLFLHLEDLKDAWREKHGAELDESDRGLAIAGVDVADLRELLAKVWSGADESWECMRVIAARRTAAHAKAMRQAMIDSGDLPPPLV